MATSQNQAPQKPPQDDPGETNDFMSNLGGYDVHAWTTLNQIFERLGKMDQKIDQLGIDQGKLKDSVEKHDRLITRVVAWGAGAIAVIVALWFLYDHFLKDHLSFK